MKNIFKRSYTKIATCFLLLTGVTIPLKGWSSYSNHEETDSKIFIAAMVVSLTVKSEVESAVKLEPLTETVNSSVPSSELLKN